MKHTLRGRHGHLISFSDGTGDPKKVCVPIGHQAKCEFLSEALFLRQEISVKFKVCMDCFGTKNLRPSRMGPGVGRAVVNYCCDRCYKKMHR